MIKVICIRLFPAFCIFFLLLSCNRGGKAPVEPEADTQVITAYFFYEEVCEPCNDDEFRFNSIVRDQIPMEDLIRFPVRFLSFNTYETAGGSLFLKITEEYEIDKNDLTLPVLILEGNVLQGYDSINRNIYRLFLYTVRDNYSKSIPMRIFLN